MGHFGGCHRLFARSVHRLVVMQLRIVAAQCELDKFDERRPEIPRSHLPIAKNLLVIHLHNSVFAVLRMMVHIKANCVEVAGIGPTYLHVSNWDQQLRQTVLRSRCFHDVFGRIGIPPENAIPSKLNGGNEYLDKNDSND